MFTISFATFRNYQDVFMYKTKPKVNPTFINRDIMVYELKAGTLETSEEYWLPQNSILKLFNIPLKIINYTLIPYVNNNEMKFGFVTYYPLHVDSL